MTIFSIFEDTYSFFKTLLTGNKIDVLFGGEISFFFLIITLYICKKLFDKGKIKVLKLCFIIICVTLFITWLLGYICPIELISDDSNSYYYYDDYDGVVLGQFWRPFYLMTSFYEILNIYISSLHIPMIISIFFTITFKHLYKLWQFIIFYILTFGGLIGIIMLNNHLHNGAVILFDLGIPIITFPAMILGWLLARILIALNHIKYEEFHKQRQAYIKQDIPKEKLSFSIRGISQVKNARFIMSELIRDKRSCLLVTITLYLTITVSFISMLICFRIIERNKLISEDNKLASKTYDDVFVNAENFLSGGDFLFALETAQEEFGINYEGLQVQLNEMPLYFDVEGLGRVDDSFMMVSDNINSGEIHINEKALYNGVPLNIGDECSIGGRTFTVTEIGKMTELYLYDLSYIKANMKELRITFDSIVTENVLDKPQREELESILNCSELISKQDKASEQNRSVAADQMLICILIAVLSVLVIVSLFKQVMISSSKRIAMFRLYGAKDVFIASFFIIYIFEYIAISFTVAMVIYKLCGGVFKSFYLNSESSVSMKAYAFGVVFLLSVIFNLPQLIIMLKKKPAQLAVRR